MVSFVNLGMRYGGVTLFEHVNIQLNPGKRYGVTGANGSGKTTLLKIINGDETGFEGSVNVPRDAQIGTLRQDHYSYEGWRVVDVVLSGNASLWQAMLQKKELIEEGGQNVDTASQISQLEEVIEKNEGYSAESRACRLLAGLGIDPQKHFGSMGRLSGGFKLRVLLARLLFQNPDILLLDEPTNHLDIISIAWLERYLTTSFKGLIVLVSHDRHFLNRVATHIADVDFHNITLYTGNYDDFMEARALAMEYKVKEIASMEKRVEQIQQFVDRFKAKASKARQAQSRAKQIERIEIPDIVRSSRRYPAIAFKPLRPSGKEVLELKNITKSFGTAQVLHGITLSLMRGQKAAIVGPNGIGKSTLLKIIMGKLEPDSGTSRWGFEARPAYFAQDHHDNLGDGKVSVFDWLYGAVSDATPGGVRGALGALLFTESDTKKPISALSGGQAARLALAAIMQHNPNILVLDEPTNHLDLESIESLENALNDFSGSVIFVSHDKRFVSAIADVVFELTDSGMEIHDGSYQDYLESLGQDYLEHGKRQGKGKTKRELSDHQASYQSRKELAKAKTKMEKELNKIEGQIEATEKEIARLDALFSDPSFYEGGHSEEVRQAETNKKEQEERLQELLRDWELTHEKVAQLEKELTEDNP